METPSVPRQTIIQHSTTMKKKWTVIFKMEDEELENANSFWNSHHHFPLIWYIFIYGFIILYTRK